MRLRLLGLILSLKNDGKLGTLEKPNGVLYNGQEVTLANILKELILKTRIFLFYALQADPSVEVESRISRFFPE